MKSQTFRRNLEQAGDRAPLLTRPDAARALSVGLRTLDTLIANGDLPVVRIGAAVRIRPSAVDCLIEARESRSNPKRKGGKR